MNNAGNFRGRLSREKAVWLLLIVLLMTGIFYVFYHDRYVGASQDFGPVTVSAAGGTSPFNVSLRLQCGSEDNSYLSDVTNIHCQILARSNSQPMQDMSFHVLILNGRNESVADCNAYFQNISNSSETPSYCLNSMGSEYFELPSGDLKVVVKQFSEMGGGVVVTKANPVTFRGELHVISAFEKQTRLSQDGASLATFLAFIFIIPATILTVRTFLRE